ncbi:YegP family protein [Nonomuraea sediminis]|uniref:YegP family protein n=1 Tax=Nonomuraea sediminis TaxID=2835864 RepID=UPI001BDD8E40|nr:YegP family protein [Nonomuraea sediminis]
MAGKFVISKDKRGEYRFKLVAANGQTIAVSEGYSTKAACVNGVESVRKNAPDATVDDTTLAAV